MQVPPTYVFGYDVRDLPCDNVPAPTATTADFSLTYGLWLAPSAGKVGDVRPVGTVADRMTLLHAVGRVGEEIKWPSLRPCCRSHDGSHEAHTRSCLCPARPLLRCSALRSQPPKSYSKAPQRCHLIVLLSDMAYRSTSSFPCNMRQYSGGESVPLALKQGCCGSPSLS